MIAGFEEVPPRLMQVDNQFNVCKAWLVWAFGVETAGVWLDQVRCIFFECCLRTRKGTYFIYFVLDFSFLFRLPLDVYFIARHTGDCDPENNKHGQFTYWPRREREKKNWILIFHLDRSRTDYKHRMTFLELKTFGYFFSTSWSTSRMSPSRKYLSTPRLPRLLFVTITYNLPNHSKRKTLVIIQVLKYQFGFIKSHSTERWFKVCILII